MSYGGPWTGMPLLGNEDGVVQLPHPAESSHVTRPS